MARKRKPPERIYAMATVNLPGLRAGQRAWVDPAQPYERRCLEQEFLVVVTEDGGWRPWREEDSSG